MKHFNCIAIAALAVLSLLCACKEEEPAAILVSSVKINYESEVVMLEVGKSVTLTATVLPEDATDKTVSWSSQDPSVASVSDKGVVTGVAAGSTRIECSAGGKTASIAVEVVPDAFCEAEGEWPHEMSVGQTAEVAVSTNVSPVTWTSSQPSVIEVVATEGDIIRTRVVLKALSAGQSEIVAFNGIKEYHTTITVKEVPSEIPATEVTLNKTAITLLEGESEALTATVLPENATHNQIAWRSSDKNVATVSKDGLVHAVKAGSATITATVTADGVSASCEVTVVKEEIHATGITLSNSSMTLHTNGAYTSARLDAELTPVRCTDPIVWSTSDKTVATVTVEEGSYYRAWVEAVAPGICVITAKAGNYKATCTVTVQQQVTGISIRDKYVYPDPDWFENEALHLTEGDEFYLKNLYFDKNYETGNPIALKVWTEDESVVKGEAGNNRTIKVKALRPKISGSTVKSVRLWVAVEENPEVKDYVDVYVHSAPTGLSISSTKEERMIKHGTSRSFTCTVMPATAKQRVKINSIPNTVCGSWGYKVSGTSVQITAPKYISGKDERTFFGQSYEVYLQTVQSGGFSAPLFFPVYIMMWDSNDVKPLDYVYYNTSTGRLRSSDGGLRSVYDPINMSNGVVAVRTYCSPWSNEQTRAIITFVGDNPDDGARENNEYWGYDKLCGFSNAPDAHGFAMAITNAPLNNSDTFKWSDDRDDVDASDNWPGMDYVTKYRNTNYYNPHWYEAFGLTFCAALYNHRRGNSHDIKPLKALLQYAQENPVGRIGLGGRDDLDGYNTRWVLPTVGIATVSGWNGREWADVFGPVWSPLFEERIKFAGGDLSTYEVGQSWTINTYDADWAWQVNGIHGSIAYKTNSTEAGLVPWLIF